MAPAQNTARHHPLRAEDIRRMLQNHDAEGHDGTDKFLGVKSPAAEAA